MVDEEESNGEMIEVNYVEEAVPGTLFSTGEESSNHDVDEVTDTNPTTGDIPSQSIFARQARFISRHAWKHLLLAFIVSLALSVVAFVVGGVPTMDNTGWLSRGTLIAERSTQMHIISENVEDLLGNYRSDEYKEELWNKLVGTPQDNFLPNARRLVENNSTTVIKKTDGRNLQQLECLTDEYMKNIKDMAGQGYHLTSMWKPKDGISAFDKRVFQDICEAEQKTMSVLEREGICQTCAGVCIFPLSIVLFARLRLDNFFPCKDLADEWAKKRSEVEKEFWECVEELKEGDWQDNPSEELPTQCPPEFMLSFVDGDFGADQNFVSYTSSVFLVKGLTDIGDTLYKLVDEYDRAEESELVEGAYDTKWEHFSKAYAQPALNSDIILATGSAVITAVAILVHTRSIWITIIGLFQICLSFPLSYFVYKIIFGLQYFPVLNFIGIFVIFALGADDIFVAVDKWKNIRLDYPSATTEEVAGMTLPDAAGAMLLTTVTTAVAFFGTALCQVAALRVFGIFCGLLVLIDYFMCILLVFPALCIYDKWLSRGNNFCCSCHVCKKRPSENSKATENGEEAKGVENGEEISSLPNSNLDYAKNEVNTAAAEELRGIEKNSFIRRVILGFYFYFHKIRWLVFIVSIAAIIVSAFFAARLELPKDSTVRFLNKDVEYEKNYHWRQNLLETVLEKSLGNRATVTFGITPADTGNHNNPRSGSRLVLDETFDPSTNEGQVYMLDFCNRFFEQEFASPYFNQECPVAAFNEWLGEMANSATPENVYTNFCGNADGLPMPQEYFDLCLFEWAELKKVPHVLQRNGSVKVIYFYYRSRVRFDRPYNELHNEWNLIEDWMNVERAMAPAGAKNVFQSSGDFWWYDTNKAIQKSAYVSAGIALAFASCIVLISSRSVVLMLFALVTIGYVLTSTTAMLVASGWKLGFLESICFAILVGVSCDFVIHFGHAYAYLPGNVSRHERTKYALVRMGPSILAAAFTTICAALIMVFTVVAFFQQFAKILLFTILQATIGSFFVYTALADCIGPSDPTYLADRIMKKCCRKTEDANEDKESVRDGPTSN